MKVSALPSLETLMASSDLDEKLVTRAPGLISRVEPVVKSCRKICEVTPKAASGPAFRNTLLYCRSGYRSTDGKIDLGSESHHSLLPGEVWWHSSKHLTLRHHELEGKMTALLHNCVKEALERVSSSLPVSGVRGGEGRRAAGSQREIEQ
jgi:hypothetical protein